MRRYFLAFHSDQFDLRNNRVPVEQRAIGSPTNLNKVIAISWGSQVSHGFHFLFAAEVLENRVPTSFSFSRKIISSVHHAEQEENYNNTR